MMNWPKVSLVTPSYNQGQFVERTVRSVLFQDYPNLEYIFMDGGSTDGTMEAIAPYLDRFGYWRSKRDGGQAAAVHEGLEKASGDIMGYINSDDLLAPGAITKVVDYFRDHPDVDVVYSHRIFIDEHDIISRMWILPPHSNYLMSRWDLLPQETCFWRRRVFERVGNVDVRMTFALDYDLFVRFMRAGKFARINAFLGAFRLHKASKTVSLFGTVGINEVQAVRQRYHLHVNRSNAYLGIAFFLLTDRLGSLYARFPIRRLSWLLGTRGLDYGSIWDGRLGK
jgi:glycosyltransferase involved in cell wall biosynthesis